MDYWVFVNRFELYVANKISDDDLRLVYVLQHCTMPICKKLKHINDNKYKSSAYRKVWQKSYER